MKKHQKFFQADRRKHGHQIFIESLFKKDAFAFALSPQSGLKSEIDQKNHAITAAIKIKIGAFAPAKKASFDYSAQKFAES